MRLKLFFVTLFTLATIGASQSQFVRQSLGGMAYQNPASVAITGGSVVATTIGSTSAARFTTAGGTFTVDQPAGHAIGLGATSSFPQVGILQSGTITASSGFAWMNYYNSALAPVANNDALWGFYVGVTYPASGLTGLDKRAFVVQPGNGDWGLYVDNTFTTNIRNRIMGSTHFGGTTITMSNGEVGYDKITASGVAPGAGTCKTEFVAGTVGGTCKMIAYCGTSTTPTTIADAIGGGC